MSEFEPDLPPSDNPDWVGLILDVENRFEALNEALADLRGAVIRLSAYHPPVQVIEVSAPVEPEPVEDAVVAEAHSEAGDGALADVAPQESPAPIAAANPAESPVTDAAAAEAPAVEDDEAKRAEVSRIVAQARQGRSTPPVLSFDGSWAAPHDPSEVDSTSEGSWPMARPREAPSAPAAPRPPAEDPAAEAAPDANAPDQDDESRREDGARMVAQTGGGPDSTAEARTEATAAVVEEEPRRDVAGMVAEMRAQMVSSEPTEVEEPAAEQEDESRSGEVAETVARMPSETSPGNSADAEEAGAVFEGGEAVDDVGVRDEVRRAVEAARAEMASGWVDADSAEASGAEDSGEKKFSFPDWQNAHMEPSGPPVLVIKDTEGRVELARVYETLSQVNCDENAALLNYTPHSVTVGLNSRASVPTKEALETAVEVVFGRKCRVESDGVRLSVDIGRDFGKEDVA